MSDTEARDGSSVGSAVDVVPKEPALSPHKITPSVSPRTAAKLRIGGARNKLTSEQQLRNSDGDVPVEPLDDSPVSPLSKSSGGRVAVKSSDELPAATLSNSSGGVSPKPLSKSGLLGRKSPNNSSNNISITTRSLIEDQTASKAEAQLEQSGPQSPGSDPLPKKKEPRALSLNMRLFSSVDKSKNTAAAAVADTSSSERKSPRSSMPSIPTVGKKSSSPFLKKSPRASVDTSALDAIILEPESYAALHLFMAASRSEESLEVIKLIAEFRASASEHDARRHAQRIMGVIFSARSQVPDLLDGRAHQRLVKLFGELGDNKPVPRDMFDDVNPVLVQKVCIDVLPQFWEDENYAHLQEGLNLRISLLGRCGRLVSALKDLGSLRSWKPAESKTEGASVEIWRSEVSTYAYRGAVNVPSSMDKVVDMLSDLKNYPRFFPEVFQSCELLRDYGRCFRVSNFALVQGDIAPPLPVSLAGFLAESTMDSRVFAWQSVANAAAVPGAVQTSSFMFGLSGFLIKPASSENACSVVGVFRFNQKPQFGTLGEDILVRVLTTLQNCEAVVESLFATKFDDVMGEETVTGEHQFPDFSRESAYNN